MRSWQNKSFAILGTCGMILQFLQVIVLAGPLQRSTRTIREVYPEIEQEKLDGNHQKAEVCIVGDVVYGAEEPVPADQPCLKCRCQPPGVQCETMRCIKKPGCRAIHKSNSCCPEYQCECEHEGRFYANGERLETPLGGECKVCYCRGGEVQCAEVSCYIRSDCKGRTVPGQCCPKYDHCPPREPLIDRSIAYTTQNTSSSNQITTPTYDNVPEVTHNKIITETQTKPTIYSEPPESEAFDESNNIHIHEIDPINESIRKMGVSKITIQEIIPEIKEIPITGPPKREINLYNLEGPLLNEEFETTKAHDEEKENNVSSDLALGDTDSDSSEILEVYHHPPPVLKIGDQLLFLKKGELVAGSDISTPVPVITIIGAEGLQRGTEDSGEDAGQKENETTTENQARTHIISLVKPRFKMAPSPFPTIEDFLMNLTQTTDDGYFQTSDATTRMLTDSVINRIKTLTNVEVEATTNVAHMMKKVFISDVNASKTEEEWYEVRPSFENSSAEATLSETSLPTQLIQHQNATEARYEELGEAKEQNPEYPPIPDVMSQQNLEELAEHLDVIDLHSHENTSQKNTTAIGILAAELSKNLNITTHPLINQNSALSTSLLNEMAPSDLGMEDASSTLIDSKRPTRNHISPNKDTVGATTSSSDRSKETLEEFDQSSESKESTTPKNTHHASMSSTEDASVETTQQSNREEIDMTDLVETITGIQGSAPKTTQAPMTVTKKDVELIDPQLINNLKVRKDEMHDEESDAIFKELNEELKTVPSFVDHKGDADAEAEAIFKELLQEATSSTISPGGGFLNGRNKESQLLQKVSDVIAKFQLKESQEPLDSSILGILKDFFSSQYKYYDGE